MTSTDSGTLEIRTGTYAAKHALKPLSEYSAMLNAAESGTTQREGSSTLDKVGAGAGVVGAIAGIAGLAKSSGKNEDVLGIDVINYCDYPVITYNITSTLCSMKESPRTIYTGDNTLIQIGRSDGFVQYESELHVTFLVGSNGLTPVHLIWKMGYYNRWTVDYVEIDGTRRDFNYDFRGNTDQLGCACFEGNAGWPSFSVFFHTVMYDTAKTFIIFTKLGNIVSLPTSS